jgi:ubiquinone/menaquinone biosynthesis C-methylase UbiE
MGEEQSFFASLHNSTKRDYLARMLDDKVHCMEVARRFDKDFFDGERRYGFGGYRYDGRWLPMARAMSRQYALPLGAHVLEAGCGKGYLLYEFTNALPDCQVSGFDISAYAVANSKPEIQNRLIVHNAKERWPYSDKEFDFVFSVAALHNLPVYDLKFALAEMERVGKRAYLCVESYRNPEELFALQCWALTAEAFFSDQEWQWLFQEFGYSGDYEFIHF